MPRLRLRHIINIYIIIIINIIRNGFCAGAGAIFKKNLWSRSGFFQLPGAGAGASFAFLNLRSRFIFLTGSRAGAVPNLAGYKTMYLSTYLSITLVSMPG